MSSPLVNGRPERNVCNQRTAGETRGPPPPVFL